jgi:pyochelin biosynthetic protein PchG
VNGARRLRAAVCGTTFGQLYLEAFRAPDCPFELAAVVARGSAAAEAVARRYGVPCVRDVELLRDVDVACVVVRAGIVGGAGSELAQTLMRRGVHVLQEHPLHHDELAECLRTARRAGVRYRMNAFYAHLEAVRRFVAAARALLRQQPAVFVDATCGFQLAYSLFEILADALGTVRPWSFDAAPRPAGGAPRAFRTLEGVLGGVPLTLRVQNQLDPDDPDNFAHVMHRITIGTESGNLMLVNTNGPVLWTPRLHVRAQTRAGTSARERAGDDVACPSVVPIGPPDAPDWDELFASHWPAAAGRALLELDGAIAAEEDALERGQLQLALCRLTQEMSARLGPPDLVRNAPPRSVDAGALIEAARATAAEAAV